MRRSKLGLLLLVFGCAFALRSVFVESYPGWFLDEGLYLEYAKNMMAGKVGLFGANTIQPAPLFLFLSSLWFRLFGVSVISGRMLTSTLGSLSVLLVFLIGRKLWDEKVGLLGSLLLCVSHSALNLNRLFMLDTGVEFFSLIALLAMIHDLDSQTTRSALLAGIAVGLPSVVKIHGVSSIMTLILVYLFCGVSVRRMVLVALLALSVFLVYPVFSLCCAQEGFLWEITSHSTRSWGGFSKAFSLDILAISGVLSIVALLARSEVRLKRGNIVLFAAVFSAFLVFALLYFAWWDIVQVVPILCLATAAGFVYFLQCEKERVILILLFIFGIDYILLRGQNSVVQQALSETYRYLKASAAAGWILRGAQLVIIAAVLLPLILLMRAQVSGASREESSRWLRWAAHSVFLLLFVAFPVLDFGLTIRYVDHDGPRVDFECAAAYLERVVDADDVVIANPVLAFQLPCRAIPWSHAVRYQDQPEIFEWDCGLENVRLAVIDDHWRAVGTVPWSPAHKDLYDTVATWPLVHSCGSIAIRANPKSAVGQQENLQKPLRPH